MTRVYGAGRELDGVTRRQADHAYPDDPNRPTAFAPGEGVVGQVARTGEPDFSRPGADALRVQFGLGDLAPAQIITYPLITNDATVGGRAVRSIPSLEIRRHAARARHRTLRIRCRGVGDRTGPTPSCP